MMIFFRIPLIVCNVGRSAYLMARNGANCVVKKIRSATQIDFLAFDYFKNANDVAIEIRMRMKKKISSWSWSV